MTSLRPVRKSLVALLFALAVLATGAASARANIGALRWGPPPLTNPTVVELGQGVTNTSLNTSKDYIVKLPPYQKVGGTEIQGGRNVVIIGGSIAIPPGLSSDSERRGIYIKNNEGTVHIEGVLIQGEPGAIGDGIDISSPDSTVQIENDRIVNLSGGLSGFHADVVQPWGGVRDLRVDGLTGSSNYQGLFLAQDLGPIGSVTLQRVNLFQTPGPYDGGGHMLWVTRGTSACTSYPLSLSNVYVQPRDGRTLGSSVWPQVASSLACPAAYTAGELSWPGLAVSGGVSGGAPPSGDFVPDGVAGLQYVSPGYGDGTAVPDPSTGAGAPPASAGLPPVQSPSPAPCAGCRTTHAGRASTPHKTARSHKRHHKKHKRHKAKHHKGRHHKGKHHKVRRGRHP